MPAVSKKQQRYFGYLLSNPEERKKKGISKKAAKDFAQDIQEVSPPGWGHTKAEKEKTKPWKPKSKIGGTAAAFKRALDDGRFKGLPGSKTKKEKTADMFKLMWSMKKKGDHPHYKPGTDKKYKKYQKEDWKPEIEVIDTKARAKKAEKKRKEAEASLPPHLKLDVMKKAFASEEITPSPNVSRKDRTAIDKRFKNLFKKDVKGTVQGVNEDSYVKDYEKLKKKIGSKEKHDKPAIQESKDYQDWQKAAREAHARVKQAKLDQHKKNSEDLYKERGKGIKFYDKKGSGRIIGGRKKYD